MLHLSPQSTIKKRISFICRKIKRGNNHLLVPAKKKNYIFRKKKKLETHNVKSTSVEGIASHGKTPSSKVIHFPHLDHPQKNVKDHYPHPGLFCPHLKENPHHPVHRSYLHSVCTATFTPSTPLPLSPSLSPLSTKSPWSSSLRSSEEALPHKKITPYYKPKYHAGEDVCFMDPDILERKNLQQQRLKDLRFQLTFKQIGRKAWKTQKLLCEWVAHTANLVNAGGG